MDSPHAFISEKYQRGIQMSLMHNTFQSQPVSPISTRTTSSWKPHQSQFHFNLHIILTLICIQYNALSSEPERNPGIPLSVCNHSSEQWWFQEKIHNHFSDQLWEAKLILPIRSATNNPEMNRENKSKHSELFYTQLVPSLKWGKGSKEKPEKKKGIRP